MREACGCVLGAVPCGSVWMGMCMCVYWGMRACEEGFACARARCGGGKWRYGRVVGLLVFWEKGRILNWELEGLYCFAPKDTIPVDTKYRGNNVQLIYQNHPPFVLITPSVNMYLQRIPQPASPTAHQPNHRSTARMQKRNNQPRLPILTSTASWAHPSCACMHAHMHRTFRTFHEPSKR